MTDNTGTPPANAEQPTTDAAPPPAKVKGVIDVMPQTDIFALRCIMSSIIFSNGTIPLAKCIEASDMIMASSNFKVD